MKVALTLWQINCQPCRSSVHSMRFNLQIWWQGQGQTWGPASRLSMRPLAETSKQAIRCNSRILQSMYWAKQCPQGARKTSSMLFHLSSSVESQATISHQRLNRPIRLWSMSWAEFTQKAVLQMRSATIHRRTSPRPDPNNLKSFNSALEKFNQSLIAVL